MMVNDENAVGMYQVSPSSMVWVADALNVAVDAHQRGRMRTREMQRIIMDLRFFLEEVGVVEPLFNYRLRGKGGAANGEG